MMTDVFSRAKRSWIMSRVRGKDTLPELTVRSLAHSLGYRFRLHRSDLPGKPDLAFLSRRKVIFVHGCFWHGHKCARGNRLPKSNRSYWCDKIKGNAERDKKHRRSLKRMGWSYLVIWECQLKDPARLVSRLTDFLESAYHKSSR